jgi:hypothetical protein
MPFFVAGTPFIQLAMAPTRDKLRPAVAAIMTRAGVADCHKNVASIQVKWRG